MISADLQPLAVPIESVRPLEGNPRRGEVEKVAASLKAFGQRKPIVVRRATSEVIAGNHTLAAAKSLGWDEIAVTWTDDDEVTAKAYALADNRTAELGGYDDVDLAQMMSEVYEADADLFEATAWTTAELEELLADQEPKPALNDKDDVPSITPDPYVQVGDLWLLGPHRLLCGDTRSPRDMDLVMGGVDADLVWMDPPYGVAVVGGTKDKLTIKNDEVDGDKLELLLKASFDNVLAHTRPGACWYVASPSGPFFAIFGNLLTKLGVWRQTIVWVKDSLVLGRSDFHGRHESIFYGWTPGEEGMVPPPFDTTDFPDPDVAKAIVGDHFNEDAYDNIIYGWTPGAAHQAPPTRKQDTVWEFPKPRRNPDHPTMKPVDLVQRALESSSKPGWHVLDGFGGSGTTLIAAHHSGRRAHLIELDPVYAQVICRRYQEHTGTIPILESRIVGGARIEVGDPHSFADGATPRGANKPEDKDVAPEF